MKILALIYVVCSVFTFQVASIWPTYYPARGASTLRANVGWNWRRCQRHAVTMFWWPSTIESMPAVAGMKRLGNPVSWWSTSLRMTSKAIRGASKRKFQPQNSIQASRQCVEPFSLWADWIRPSPLIAPVRRQWHMIWILAIGGIARTPGIRPTMSGNQHVPPSMCPALTPRRSYHTMRFLVIRKRI